MNRMALGLAIGAGYFLGRTRKMKMAVAVGSLVAGKKLNLGPGMLADLARQQLRDNPQFKEIGDQLRQDLQGVGKAASGAVVERQIGALADRLHDRTARVRKDLSGAAPLSGSGEEPDEEDFEARGDEDREEWEERQEREEHEDQEGREDGEARRAREDQPSGEERAKNAIKKGPKKGPPRKVPGKKALGKKTAAPAKAAAKRTGAVARSAVQQATAGARSDGSRESKGGDDR